MKCLSVRNPYANWIASGKKPIETRTWRTHHRGPLLIHTSKTGPGPNNGKVVALVQLVDCRLMRREDEALAWCQHFNDLYAWVMEDIRRLQEPFPVRGQLTLFEVDYDPARF